MRARLALAGLPDIPIQHKWSCFDHFIGQIQTLYSLFARSTCSEGPFGALAASIPAPDQGGTGQPGGPAAPWMAPSRRCLTPSSAMAACWTDGPGISQRPGVVSEIFQGINYGSSCFILLCHSFFLYWLTPVTVNEFFLLVSELD